MYVVVQISHLCFEMQQIVTALQLPIDLLEGQKLDSVVFF